MGTRCVWLVQMGCARLGTWCRGEVLSCAGLGCLREHSVGYRTCMHISEAVMVLIISIFGTGE